MFVFDTRGMLSFRNATNITVAGLKTNCPKCGGLAVQTSETDGVAFDYDGLGRPTRAQVGELVREVMQLEPAVVMRLLTDLRSADTDEVASIVESDPRVRRIFDLQPLTTTNLIAIIAVIVGVLGLGWTVVQPGIDEDDIIDRVIERLEANQTEPGAP